MRSPWITTTIRPELLIDCALSVASQTVPPDEWIVYVDTEYNESYVATLVDIVPDIRIIHSGKIGRSKALNLAHVLASHDYVAWLDDDDYLANNAIELVLKALENHDFVYSNYWEIKGNKLCDPITNNLDFSMELLCKKNILMGFRAFKKSLYKQIPEDLLAGIDYHLFARIAYEIKPYKMRSKIYYKRQHYASISGKRSKKQQAEFTKTQKWLMERYSVSV